MLNTELNSVEMIIEKIDESLNLELIEVTGGTFSMGTEDSGFDDDSPVHSVEVSDFYLGRNLVTNKDYVAFLNDVGENKEEGGSTWVQLMGRFEGIVCGIEQVAANTFKVKPGLEEHPMVYVSWYGAMAYCNWLSEKTGDNYRLPSEAEWEYAARGGLENKGLMYAGSNKLKEVGWYKENTYLSTFPVGLKLPNELGLNDMSGNVWEWCMDHWHENYIGAPKNSTPWILNGDEALQVLRGGSWFYNEDVCHVSDRHAEDAYIRSFVIGFRVARN